MFASIFILEAILFSVFLTTHSLPPTPHRVCCTAGYVAVNTIEFYLFYFNNDLLGTSFTNYNSSHFVIHVILLLVPLNNTHKNAPDLRV